MLYPRFWPCLGNDLIYSSDDAPQRLLEQTPRHMQMIIVICSDLSCQLVGVNSSSCCLL